MQTEVSRRSGPDRYEITLEGEPVGLTRFVDVDGRRVFFHTEVDDGHAGQGLPAPSSGERWRPRGPRG